MSAYDFKSKEGVEIEVSSFNLGIEPRITYTIKNLNLIDTKCSNKSIDFTFHESLEEFSLTCCYLARSLMAYTNPRAYIEYVTVISRGLTKKEENRKLVESFYSNHNPKILRFFIPFDVELIEFNQCF